LVLRAAHSAEILYGGLTNAAAADNDGYLALQTTLHV